jgi:hypothetical protein
VRLEIENIGGSYYIVLIPNNGKRLSIGSAYRFRRDAERTARSLTKFLTHVEIKIWTCRNLWQVETLAPGGVSGDNLLRVRPEIMANVKPAELLAEHKVIPQGR